MVKEGSQATRHRTMSSILPTAMRTGSREQTFQLAATTLPSPRGQTTGACAYDSHARCAMIARTHQHTHTSLIAQTFITCTCNATRVRALSHFTRTYMLTVYHGTRVESTPLGVSCLRMKDALIRTGLKHGTRQTIHGRHERHCRLGLATSHPPLLLLCTAS